MLNIFVLSNLVMLCLAHVVYVLTILDRFFEIIDACVQEEKCGNPAPASLRIASHEVGLRLSRPARL